MSYADFNNLAIRNTTIYNSDGYYVPLGKIFTVGERGTLECTNNLGLNRLLVSSVSVASSVISYFSNTRYFYGSSIGYISSIQADALAAPLLFSGSTLTSYRINVSTLSTSNVIGTTSQFTSSITKEMVVAQDLRVIGSTIASTMNIEHDMNVLGITTLSTLYASSALLNGLVTTSLLIQSSLSTNMLYSKSNTLIGSTLNTSSIIYINLYVDSVVINSSLNVESTIFVPYIRLSTIFVSTLTDNITNVASTLAVGSTITVPTATITTINGTSLSTRVANVASTLSIGSTLTTIYGTYSTLFGSTFTTTTADMMSLTTGSSIRGLSSQLPIIMTSTLASNNLFIVSSVSVGSSITSQSIETSDLIGSTIIFSTVSVLSTVTIGSTLTTQLVQMSSIVGSTFTTTIGSFSTLLVDSTINVPSIQVSTLFGSTITTTRNNVFSVATILSTQYSSLSCSSMTNMNGVVHSSVIVGSTLNASMLSTPSIYVSTMTTNTLLTISSATISSIISNLEITPILACSSITNFLGKQLIGGDSAGVSGLVCSNLPLTLDSMTAMIDRTTKKISLSNTSAISTLYKTVYYAYNGSAWVQGDDVPPSSVPISLSTLKFPVAAYSLGTVGSWCSLSITDMTNFTGSWTVNAVCLRTGSNGDDLYGLELVQAVNATAVTSVPGSPTNVVTALTTGGIIFTFSPPAITGGYISTYEVFATSDGGATYYTKVGVSSPIIVTGLTIGNTYTLSMKAKNALGQSVAASGSPNTIQYTGP